MKNFLVIFFLAASVSSGGLVFSSCGREQACESDEFGILEVLETPYQLRGQYTIKAYFYSNEQSTMFNDEDDECKDIYGRIPKGYNKPGRYHVIVKLKAKNICDPSQLCFQYIYKINCIETVK